MTTLPHIQAALARQVWALEPGKLDEVLAVIERRVLRGERLSPDEIAAIRGERDPALPNGMATLFAVSAGRMIEARGPRGAGMSPAGDSKLIAVISISGIIAQHASQVDDISGPGGTSTERVGAAFRGAMADPSVSGIVLNVNSPGGTVYGLDSLADEIRSGRGQGKPIVAQVNSLAASAAYWIASAADEIVATPGADLGSIGVYLAHDDVSGAAAKAGLSRTFISAGRYKVEGNQFSPLSDEARGELQRRFDASYGDFVNAVAKGRGIAAGKVRSDFGQGRVVGARDAVRLGMADRIATLQQTLQRVAAGAGGGPSAAVSRASAHPRVPVAYGAPMPPAGVKQSPDEARKRRFTSMVGMSGPARVSGPKATAPQTAADRDHMRRRRFRQRVLGIRD